VVLVCHLNPAIAVIQRQRYSGTLMEALNRASANTTIEGKIWPQKACWVGPNMIRLEAVENWAQSWFVDRRSAKILGSWRDR